MSKSRKKKWSVFYCFVVFCDVEMWQGLFFFSKYSFEVCNYVALILFSII